MGIRVRLHPVRTSLLALVLIVALGLRLWGSSFGLPQVYHPDEGFEIYRALKLGMGEFDLERVAKGGYYYLLFAEYGVFFLWSFVTGAVTGAGDFAVRFIEDPTPFWKIGRATTAFLGTFTVLLVFLQGRRLQSYRTGLLAAWFLALSLRHVIDSHYATVDVPMTLFAFLSVFMVVEDVHGRLRFRGWLYALVAAFAVLNKLPAIVLFVPYFVGAYFRGGWTGRRGLATWATVWPPLLAGAVYIVANPGFVVFFRETLFGVSEVVAGNEQTGEYAGVGQRTNLWMYYSRALLDSQGPALLALSLLGATLGVRRRDRGVILHLSFVVPFFVLIAGAGTAHLYYERYIIPLLPALCLLAALALEDLIVRVRTPAVIGTALAVACALLFTAEKGMEAAAWDRRHCREDTRTAAARWFAENVEHKTRVLLEGFPEEPAQLSVPLRNTKKNVRSMIDAMNAKDPGKALYWQLKVEMLEPPLYDLVTVRHFEPWGKLGDYTADDVQFVVLRRERFVPDEANANKHAEEVLQTRFDFYEELRRSEGSELLAFFDASEDGAPGYDLEIWRLQPDGELDQVAADTDRDARL